MDKKVLEEINKILFLNSYKIGKTLNEQKLSDSENVLTEDYETKTKNLSLDFGDRRNKLLAKQTGSMDLDLRYTINKEIDEELTAPLNVIQKMNAELGSNYAYNSLSGEQKKLLGESYFNALEAILKAEQTAEGGKDGQLLRLKSAIQEALKEREAAKAAIEGKKI